MKSCRTASVVALVLAGVAAAVGACQKPPHAEVPPLTTARPVASGEPVLSGPAGDASVTTEPPFPIDAGAAPVPATPPPVDATFGDLPAKVEMRSCTEAAVAMVEGTATALGERLGPGDVLFVQQGAAFEVKGKGTIVTALRSMGGDDCPKTPAAQKKQVVRAAAIPALTWAKGTMQARLQLGDKQGSRLYLGRLEGSAPVGEHEHEGSWEILAAVDAAGTFVLAGKESRLGPRQVVMVPPSTKHAWRPDPGSKLVAVQMYFPRGPEQRFVGLAAADKAAGATDAGSPSK